MKDPKSKPSPKDGKIRSSEFGSVPIFSEFDRRMRRFKHSPQSLRGKIERLIDELIYQAEAFAWRWLR